MRWLLPLLVLTIIAAACGGSSDATPTPAGSPLQTIPTQRSGSRIVTPTQREFPFSTPESATPRAGVPTGIHSPDGLSAVEIPDDAAVYLSLGDSINYGCCADPNLSSHPLFAQYLSQQLNRPIVWVSLAGNGEYLREEQCDTLIERLAPLSNGQVIESDTVLWQSWWWFLPVVLLLTIEWILRKRFGLL